MYTAATHLYTLNTGCPRDQQLRLPGVSRRHFDSNPVLAVNIHFTAVLADIY